MNLPELPILEIAKIIIPGVIAFITGRYFSIKSERTSAFRESFFNVYKPLFSIIKPYMYENISDKKELLEYLKQMSSCIKENSHLVFDDLEHELTVLINRIEGEFEFKSEFDHVCFSIEKTYFKLKKSLGYPVYRRVSYFIRNFSWRRFKVRFQRIDILISELLFVSTLLIGLILLSSFLYDFLIFLTDWLNGLDIQKEDQ